MWPFGTKLASLGTRRVRRPNHDACQEIPSDPESRIFNTKNRPPALRIQAGLGDRPMKATSTNGERVLASNAETTHVGKDQCNKSPLSSSEAAFCWLQSRIIYFGKMETDSPGKRQGADRAMKRRRDQLLLDNDLSIFSAPAQLPVGPGHRPGRRPMPPSGARAVSMLRDKPKYLFLVQHDWTLLRPPDLGEDNRKSSKGVGRL